MFYVQRCYDNIWEQIEPFGYITLYDAKNVASKLELGTSKPEPLRIVDENGVVHAWVSRNGWLPTGGLAPWK